MIVYFSIVANCPLLFVINRLAIDPIKAPAPVKKIVGGVATNAVNKHVQNAEDAACFQSILSTVPNALRTIF
jgi:hypothetical protein